MAQPSHLIPASIVDKNGKFIAVHTKAINSTRSLTLFPTMASLAASDDACERFLSLFNFYPSNDATRNYDLINKHDPTIIPFLTKLLTSGNEGARLRAVASVSALFTNMNAGFKMYKSTLTDEEVNQFVAKNYLENLKSRTTVAWHIGYLMEDLHIPNSEFSSAPNVPYSVKTYHEKYHPSPLAEDTIADYEYWRGLVLLAIAMGIGKPMTFDNIHEQSIPESSEFIAWAGAHKNAKRVYELVRERATIDVTRLKELMGEDGTTPAISDGIL